MTTTTEGAVREQFARLFELATELPDDLEAEVRELLRAGAEHPLADAEADALLARVLERLQTRAREDGQEAMVAVVTAGVRRLRAQLDGHAAAETSAKAGAATAQPVDDGREAVRPTPRFAGREVPMWRREADPRALVLWANNDRIGVHVEQFRETRGREPTSEEVLNILLSREQLDGMSGEDQFLVEALADDIASFGLERAPILGRDGDILDGNRRVAACLFILTDPRYPNEARERVRRIVVHELSEFATPEDADWVVTSLNFRSDHKQEWSHYIKARKIYREWQRMTALRPDATARELAEMKRQLAQRFAMGNRTDTVNRYIRMVDLAEEFETFMVEDRGKDAHEVRHRAMERFQFFDELTKGGSRTQGAAHALEQSDRLRDVVYDLLYQGKFANWSQVRDLKFVPENADVLDELEHARGEEDVEKGKRVLKNALVEARRDSPESVELPGDLRISQFVKWLEKISVSGYRNTLRVESLERLLQALRLVEGMLERIVAERRGQES